jgi:hypothetical protein
MHSVTVRMCLVCVAAFVPCCVLQLAQRRNIDPLAPVDHSLIEYDDFAKDFYTEHPSITSMTDQQVRIWVWQEGVIAWGARLQGARLQGCVGHNAQTELRRSCCQFYTAHPSTTAMTDQQVRMCV